MQENNYKVCTKGGCAVVIDTATRQVITSFPLYSDPNAPHTNSVQCAPGYVSAVLSCKALNIQYNKQTQ